MIFNCPHCKKKKTYTGSKPGAAFSKHKWWCAGGKFPKEWYEKQFTCHDGPKNGRWKGANASYINQHKWFRQKVPKPNLCPHCGIREPKDLANISHKYFFSADDYMWLCRICHLIYDGITKLSKEQVLEIRSLRSGGMKLKDIGKMYGVSFQHVSLLARKKSWSHLK